MAGIKKIGVPASAKPRLTTNWTKQKLNHQDVQRLAYAAHRAGVAQEQADAAAEYANRLAEEVFRIAESCYHDMRNSKAEAEVWKELMGALQGQSFTPEEWYSLYKVLLNQATMLTDRIRRAKREPSRLGKGRKTNKPVVVRPVFSQTLPSNTSNGPRAMALNEMTATRKAK